MHSEIRKKRVLSYSLWRAINDFRKNERFLLTFVLQDGLILTTPKKALNIASNSSQISQVDISTSSCSNRLLKIA